ncbi:MAG: HemK/PrmC family methyltransferase [Candidatus Saccharibacteria bacterium]|nr:HemK/PrmC family methyltransferase [Candidatus Saccharibacteria bacterium]
MSANSKKKPEDGSKSSPLKFSKLDQDLILLDVLKRAGLAPKDADRSFLVAHDVELSTELEEEYHAMLDRRKNGEPLAYILGFREFYGREFKTDSRALVPRPETEDIIEFVKDLDGNFYDIGTGTGCIAITLKLENPTRKVTAIDISEDALSLAKENANSLGADIEFIKNDLIEGLSIQENSIIIANLPYVDRGWDWIDEKTLEFEPDTALYAENEGLEIILELLDQISELSRPQTIILEADPCQHQKIIDYAEKLGMKLDKISNFIVKLNYD